jgi:hypothetical protein
MKTEITINIDTDALDGYTDDYIVCLWATAQANPAPIENRDAGDVAEAVGREIIRRFVKRVGLPLWNHQGHHSYWMALRELGTWKDGEFVPHATPEAAPCTSL